MEDKSLENLFAQFDAEAQTEAKTEEPAEEPAEAGTDPRAKSACLDPEEIEMWDAVFIEELNRAIENPEHGKDNGTIVIEQADGSGGHIVWHFPKWVAEKDENSTFTTEEVHELFRCFANNIVQSAKTDKALNAALAEYKSKKQLLEKPAESIKHFKYKPFQQLEYVTDRLQFDFFTMLAPWSKKNPGQKTWFPLKYGGAKDSPINLFVNYEYNESLLKEHGIEPCIDPFDSFVILVCDNMFEAGNRVVSLSNIYAKLGYSSRINEKGKQITYNALLKAGTTIMRIDDGEVSKAYKKESFNEMVSPIFPNQIIAEKHMSNGMVADTSVRLLGHSPFYELARKLGDRIQTLPNDFLTRYNGKRTWKYWAVLQYTMRQIFWMIKSDSPQRETRHTTKILYETLFAHVGDKTTKQENATKTVFYKVLDMFMPDKTGREYFITGYEETTEGNPGVTIRLKPELIPPPKAVQRIPQKGGKGKRKKPKNTN